MENVFCFYLLNNDIHKSALSAIDKIGIMMYNLIDMKKVAIFGLGPHARRIYYPYLEEVIAEHNDISLELVVDLDTNKKYIEKWLTSRKLQPKHKIYLSADEQINPSRINDSVTLALQKYGINKAILSTEPKSHKVYLKKCIELGIPVVTDKPVTSPVFAEAGAASPRQIADDVDELQALLKKHPESRVLVQCQRRNHKGYQLVLKTVEEVVKQYGVPITYINIHHSDGMWNMPDEFVYRENHPYKYGYGKLMHSGYHFIDLLATLFNINTKNISKPPDTLNIFSQGVHPLDQHMTLDKEIYDKFFGADIANKFSSFMNKDDLKSYGEVDSFSQLQLVKEGKVQTTAQLSLMQSGFSQRAWSDLPEDAYKSNGRIRHELVDIHIGPLLSVQVHSYQSLETSSDKAMNSEPGGKNHFEIYIFRNIGLIGGKAFERINFGEQDTASRNDSYIGHNEKSRHAMVDELLYDLPSNSELSDHVVTNKILSLLYTNHILQKSNAVPYGSYPAKEIFDE